MQQTAIVPVEFIKKPTDFEPIVTSDIEYLNEAIRMDNVVRNLGRSIAEIRKESNTDFLTGAESKSSGFARMQKIIDDKDGSLEIFYLDINNFSKVNNTLGHNTGDTTLVTTATLLLGSLRDGETLHRFGGDEFVIVKDTNVQHDRRQASTGDDRTDRRQKILDETVEGLQSRFCRAFDDGITTIKEILGRDLSNQLGLSVGHAIHKDGQTVGELIEQADKDMYTRKLISKALMEYDELYESIDVNENPFSNSLDTFKELKIAGKDYEVKDTNNLSANFFAWAKKQPKFNKYFDFSVAYLHDYYEVPEFMESVFAEFAKRYPEMSELLASTNTENKDLVTEAAKYKLLMSQALFDVAAPLTWDRNDGVKPVELLK